MIVFRSKAQKIRYFGERKNKSLRIQKLRLATDEKLCPHCDVAKVVDHLVSFLKWRVDRTQGTL